MIELGFCGVDVFEPRITDVKIRGDPGPHLARLEHLSSELRAASVVRQEGVQATLQRMRALPGLSLAATTARDLELPNVYRLDIDTQFDPVSGAVRISNRGTDEGARCSCWVKRRERLARGRHQPRRDVRRSVGL